MKNTMIYTFNSGEIKAKNIQVLGEDEGGVILDAPVLCFTSTDRCFKTKPTSEDMPKIHKDMKTYRGRMYDLAKLVSNGNSYSGCTYKSDKHTIAEVDKCYLATMDFDTGVWSYDAAIKFCDELGMMPNIGYHSWSSTYRLNKFHLIWYIGETDYDTMLCIQKLIFHIFQLGKKSENEDTKSYAPTQLWGGTNKDVFLYHQDAINLLSLMSIVASFTTKSNESKILKSMTEFTGIERIIASENYGQNTINQSGDFYEVLKCKKEKFSDIKVDYSNADIKTALQKCKLLQEVTTKESEVYNHNINYSILTNLVNIKGGDKLFLKMCELNSDKPRRKHERDLCSAKNSFPRPCARFCPYASTCPCSKYSIAYIAKESNVIKHNPENVETITVDEAYTKMEKIMAEEMSKMNSLIIQKGLPSMKFNLNKINDEMIRVAHESASVIKVPTGTGKTTLFINIANAEAQRYFKMSITDRDNVPGFIYSAPRHDLAEEVYNTLISDKVTKFFGVCRVLPRPECLDKNIEEIIKNYEESGLNKLAMKEQSEYVKTLKQQKKLTEEEKEYIDAVKKYWDSREMSKKCKIVVCTHAFLKSLDMQEYNKINYIIIDEDMLNSFSKQVKIKISDLIFIKDILSKNTYNVKRVEHNFDDLIKPIDFILNAEYKKCIAFDMKKEFVCNNQCLQKLINLKNENKVNITSLLDMKSFYKTEDAVIYQTINSFDSYNKKVVILTATPAPKIAIEKILNTPVNVREVGWVKLLGKLYQNTDLSSYRNKIDDIDYFDKLVRYLEKYDIQNIITYKSFAKDFEDAGYDVKMTFGATSGMNSLKGEKFAVIGTYFNNPLSLNIMAAAFEPHKQVCNIEIAKYYKITYEGIKQKVITFKEGFLRDYHLWIMFSEMEQSVGRARLTREKDAVVVLCSQLVHPLAYQD